ncbi:MAG: iron-siderophore ABC transporter substrate-binding protein [Acidimicrobiales bacterium]|nr:iron-siderophore ABC transporter substrate-binding protein [Acidimicrobiales bacterium]
MLGSTTVTRRPERVVALGLADQDIALALGVTPVAIIENPHSDDRRYPWTSDPELDDAVILPFEIGTASIEQIVALKPDLILATTISADASLYQRYKDAGVPILAPPQGAVTASWQDLTRTIGKALGRSNEAEAVISDTEDLVSRTRASLSGIKGRTVAVAVASTSSKVRVVNKPTDTAAKFLADLGLALPERLTKLDGAGGVGAVDIGLEQLDLLDADILILASNQGAREDLERSPLFARLPAVKAGTYLPYDNTTATGLRVPTPLSIPHVIGVLKPTLERAADL